MKSGAAMRATRLTTAILASLVSSACVDAGSAADSGVPPLAEIVASPPSVEEQCDVAGPRSVQEATPQTSVVVGAKPICRLVAVHVATLSPSPSATYPDPGRGRILHHDRGILTNVAWHMGSARGSLLLWNHDGTFREVIGGPGEGPGEFAEDFRLQAYSGPDGQTHVNERRRWTVLDSTLAFVRIISAPVVGAFGNDLVVTGDGGYVRTGRSPGTDDSNWFHYFDRDGQFVRSIGPKRPGGVSNEFGRRELVIGEDPSTFWAAPPGGAPEGYVLERWSIEGELVQTLERDVPWARTAQAATGGFTGIPSFRMNRDRQGLLWVTSSVLREGVDPTEFELPAELAADETARLLELLQHRLEVIDPASGRLVAAAEMEIPTEDGTGLPFDPVAGARMGGRYVLSEGGFRSIELFDWYLVRP